MEWHEVFKGVPAEEVPEEFIAEEARERASLFSRVRQNLGRARAAVRDQLKATVYRGVSRELFEQIEEMLIAADVGMTGTLEIVKELEDRCIRKQISDREECMDELADVIACILRPNDAESQKIDVSAEPSVIFMVGVNGAGKTTTIGKMAW